MIRRLNTAEIRSMPQRVAQTPKVEARPLKDKFVTATLMGVSIQERAWRPQKPGAAGSGMAGQERLCRAAGAVR
jgi:hypothetical protein